MAYIDTELKLDKFPVGQSTCIDVGEAQVGIFRNAEGVFAIDNYCPHRGAPLHDGHMTDGYVTCPWHQWQFQLNDGICKNIPNVKVATYPIEVRDGAIWVDLDAKGTK